MSDVRKTIGDLDVRLPAAFDGNEVYEVFSGTDGKSYKTEQAQLGTAAAANLEDPIAFTNTTDATSTTAAAVKTAGGLAVAKKAFFGDAVKIQALFTEVFTKFQTGDTALNLAITPASMTHRFSSVTVRYSINNGNTSSFFHIQGYVYSPNLASAGAWTEVYSSAKTHSTFGTFAVTYNTTTGDLEITKSTGSANANGRLTVEVIGHVTNTFTES